MAHIMEWSKWTYDQVLDTPFIPILSIIRQVSTIHEQIDTDEEAATDPNKLYDPKLRQNILANPEQFRPDYGTIQQT